MSLTFAIADLHGRLDLLEMALDAISRHACPAPERTVVFLGDYIDRGPQSRQVIDRLMAGPTDGSRWICLTGNHEDIMLQAMDDERKARWWFNNGGQATLRSYGAREDDQILSALQRVPVEHQEWLRGLPEEFDDGKRFFVHAGVDHSAQSQDRQTKLWKLYEPGCRDGWRGRHVVHGHHYHQDGPYTWGGRTNLDVCAYYTGRLVIGVFDDAKEGGPVEIIEVVGDDLKETLAKAV